MREQKSKAQVKQNNNYKIMLTPCPLTHTHTHHDMNQPTPYPIPHIYNNTIDIEFLVQMRQCNKCRSVRNDEIFKLYLESVDKQDMYHRHRETDHI